MQKLFQARHLMSLCLLMGVMFVFGTAYGHHSFSMYDNSKTYVFTGVVVSINPNPNHLQIFFGVLDDARKSVLKNDNGEPIIWQLEMVSPARAAKDGITIESFSRGTIFSGAIHPARREGTFGGIHFNNVDGQTVLFKCPKNTPPAAGMHCDSLTAATRHGKAAELPEPTGSIFSKK